MVYTTIVILRYYKGLLVEVLGDQGEVRRLLQLQVGEPHAQYLFQLVQDRHYSEVVAVQ